MPSTSVRTKDTNRSSTSNFCRRSACSASETTRSSCASFRRKVASVWAGTALSKSGPADVSVSLMVVMDAFIRLSTPLPRPASVRPGAVVRLAANACSSASRDENNACVTALKEPVFEPTRPDTSSATARPMAATGASVHASLSVSTRSRSLYSLATTLSLNALTLNNRRRRVAAPDPALTTSTTSLYMPTHRPRCCAVWSRP